MLIDTVGAKWAVAVDLRAEVRDYFIFMINASDLWHSGQFHFSLLLITIFVLSSILCKKKN
jgi:hypothetical protein